MFNGRLPWRLQLRNEFLLIKCEPLFWTNIHRTVLNVHLSSGAVSSVRIHKRQRGQAEKEGNTFTYCTKDGKSEPHKHCLVSELTFFSGQT